MPFTPFHWGPSSWIGLLLFKIFDFPTLLLASVIVDVEPLFVLFFNSAGPLHGFWHSFLGGSIAAAATAVILYFLKNRVKRIMAVLGLGQDSPFKKILWTSFLGVYSHIILDSFLYTDIKPLYPFSYNPFLGLFASQQVYLFCGLSFLVGLLFYLTRLRNNQNLGRS